MIQGNLFAPAVSHYGPEPTPGLPNFRRVALCGVTFRVAGSIAEPPEPEGSSNLENVNCVACLDVVEARKRISEAGE